jgi:YHS domain-containing protein
LWDCLWLSRSALRAGNSLARRLLYLPRSDQRVIKVASEVERQKVAWAQLSRDIQGRGERLKRYEAVAAHLIEVLKPRLNGFIERFKAVAKAEPNVREHTRALNVEFASTLAKMTIRFEVFLDRDAQHVRLECTQEIIPVLVRYDKQSVLELPLDEVQDELVADWLDERIVTFVKLYLTVEREDDALKERLKDQLVEDPVAKVRFPKYLASSTLERAGRTYYFLDENTRREFDRQAATKP